MAAAWALALALPSPAGGKAAERLPNIVLILTDDQGYGDVGSFGARDLKTPNLDRLAAEGMRFTDFYVAQAVCTASRAALMTGCYPNRVGLQGALNHTSAIGIGDGELLLSELLKQKGYATAVYGKWHLGHHPKFLPTRHGFDEFFGIPYSNDNGPLHPVMRNLPPLPLIEGEKIVGQDPDQSQFTRLFTERAVRFIARNKSRPFFLYVPHVMPHVPLFASKRWKGRSARGPYGDVVEEVDWSVGQILAALDKHGLDRQTIVIFASDNGPFLSYGHHAGSAGPLREGKLTTFEGGVRVPAIMRWPQKIARGSVCREPVAAIDILPTVAEIVGGTLPSHPTDGRSILPLLLGRADAKAPREALYIYAGEELQAIRAGAFKLHLPHEYLTVAGPPGRNGKPANYENMKPLAITESGIRGIASRHGYGVGAIGLSLYDLRSDAGESRDVASQHPEIVRRLQNEAEKARAELGDALTKRRGAGLRPAGSL